MTNGSNWKIAAALALALLFVASLNLTVALVNKGKLERIAVGQSAFETRTVDRWNKLQRDNPDLKVPLVVEPLEKPHLTDEEMEANRLQAQKH